MINETTLKLRLWLSKDWVKCVYIYYITTNKWEKNGCQLKYRQNTQTAISQRKESKWLINMWKSILLAVGEIQTKTTMRNHYILTRLFKIKESGNAEHQKGGRATKKLTQQVRMSIIRATW